MKIICSAEAVPKNLFQVSAVSKQQKEDQRQLMDDLGITEVSDVYVRVTVMYVSYGADLGDTFQVYHLN